jgi:hypothetical protein
MTCLERVGLRELLTQIRSVPQGRRQRAFNNLNSSSTMSLTICFPSPMNNFKLSRCVEVLGALNRPLFLNACLEALFLDQGWPRFETVAKLHKAFWFREADTFSGHATYSQPLLHPQGIPTCLFSSI